MDKAIGVTSHLVDQGIITEEQLKSVYSPLIAKTTHDIFEGYLKGSEIFNDDYGVHTLI